MGRVKRKSAIEQAARELLKKAQISEPPVPVEKIAHQLGLSLKYKSYEGEMSGVFFRKKKVIGINSLHKQTRQRFTIAHELGHFTLHDSCEVHADKKLAIYRRTPRYGMGINLEEMEANAFASELLMPEEFLRRDLEGHVVDYEDDKEIASLADRYEVSLQAIVFRLADLGLIRSLSTRSEKN